MYDLRSAGLWGRFAWVATAISLVACQLQPTSMPTRGVLRSSPAAGPAAMTAPRKLQSVSQAKHPRRAPGIARDYAPHTGPKQNLRFHMANGRLVQDPMAPPQARHLLDTPSDGCDPALPEDMTYLGDFAACADNPDGPGYQPTITSHWYIYTFTSPDIPGTWNLVMAHVTATSPCGTVETDTAPWYGFPLEDVIANPDTYIEEHYAWTCDDDSDPSPSPSPSASPSPSTPPNSPGPSDPPSPSPSPSPPSPTPPPSASPSILPPPPRIGLAADRAFSANHDGDHIKVTASGAWQVAVQGQEGTPIRTGHGDKSFVWDGKVGGQPLPDGPYMLVLTSGGQTASAPSYLDDTGPKVTNVQFAHAATDPTATGTAYNLTANIQGDVIPTNPDGSPAPPRLGDFDPNQEDAYDVKVTGGVESEQDPSFDSGSLTLNKPITANLAELHKKTMTVTLTATDMLGNKTIVKYYPGFLFAEPAFAPGSQTSNHQTDAITVSKGDGWSLQVDNQGLIQQSTGLTHIAWGGSVTPGSNAPPATLHVLDLSAPSTVLPDGQYTLQLSPGGATSSASDPTANVIIDTRKPTISDIVLVADPTDSTGNTYTVSSAAQDAGPAGLDLSTLRVEINGVQVTGTQNPFFPSASAFSQKFTITTASAPVAGIDVSVSDNAGNRAHTLTGKDADVQRLASEYDQFESSIISLDNKLTGSCSLASSGTTAYRIQSLPIFTNYELQIILDAHDRCLYSAANDALYAATNGERAAALIEYCTLAQIPVTWEDALLLTAGGPVGGKILKSSIILKSAAAELLSPTIEALAGKFCELANEESGLWSFKARERGLLAEAGCVSAKYELPTNFPVLDEYIVDSKGVGIAKSVKSIDLSKKSYQTASGLRSTLNGYINSIAILDRGTPLVYGSTVLDLTGMKVKIFEIVLPSHGTATQAAVIAAAKKQAEALGVHCRIIYMP